MDLCCMDVLTADLNTQKNIEDCVLLDSVSACVCVGGCVHVMELL